MLLRASELDGHRGLFDASEALLVDELAQSGLQSQHFLAGRPEQELYAIEDVALAGAIEPRNGVELRVEAGDDGAVHVGLEALKNNLLYVHQIIK